MFRYSRTGGTPLIISHEWSSGNNLVICSSIHGPMYDIYHHRSSTKQTTICCSLTPNMQCSLAGHSNHPVSSCNDKLLGNMQTSILKWEGLIIRGSEATCSCQLLYMYNIMSKIYITAAIRITNWLIIMMVWDVQLFVQFQSLLLHSLQPL